MAEYDMNHLDYKATETERIAEDDAKYHIFSENWKYGYKKDDVVVIPAIYDDAMDFSEGLAAVKLNENYLRICFGFFQWYVNFLDRRLFGVFLPNRQRCRPH